MERVRNEPLKKEIHPQAQVHARNIINDFGSSLILQAKLLANKRKNETVLKEHIDEAYKIIRKTSNSTRLRDCCLGVGGALLGTGLQGFITEIATNPIRPSLVILYGIIFILGLILFLYGIWGFRD